MSTSIHSTETQSWSHQTFLSNLTRSTSVINKSHAISKRLFLISLFFLTVSVPLFAEDHSKHDHSSHKGDDHSSHEGHDHSKHKHEGPVHHLKGMKVKGHPVAVELIGEVESGKKVEIHFLLSESLSIKTVRAWIGIKSGRGSRKALLEKEEELEYHGKVEVPKKVEGELKLWLDVTYEDGTREKAHHGLPEDDDHEEHDHEKGEDNHDGHDHKEEKKHGKHEKGDHEGHGHEGHNH